MRIHPHWQFKLRTRIIHNLINDFIGIDRQYLEAVDASLWYTYRSIVYATWENQSNFFTLAVELSLDMYKMGYYIVLCENTILDFKYCWYNAHWGVNGG